VGDGIGMAGMWSTVWQQVTLNRFALHQWRQVSVIHRLLGWLRQWRQGSWLLPWADVIGLVLVALIFALAPMYPPP
jgi:putative inorganic carbon (HCO3(-)) transporter